MLVRTDLRGRTLTAAELRQAMPRGGSDPSAVTDTVATLVEDIHQHGASAALSYGEKFDGIRPTSVRVPADVIAAALAATDEAVKEALKEAIRRIRKVHAAQRPDRPVSR